MENNQFPINVDGNYYVNYQYNLFHCKDVNPLAFKVEFYNFKIFVNQYNDLNKLELYEKEIANIEINIQENQKIIADKVHPFFDWFTNNISLLEFYKKEIEKLIFRINLNKQILKNNKMVNIDDNIPFTIEIVNSKLIIDTVIRKFSWNVFAQILIVLYIDKKLDETVNNLIIPIILEKTILNNKKISKQNKYNINTRAYDYLKQNDFLVKIKEDVKYTQNSLQDITKDLLKNDKFMNKLIKSVNGLIENI